MLGKESIGKRAGKVLRNNWQLFVLMLPALVATGLFAYAPMYGIQIAFKDFSGARGIWGSEWVGFEHFIRFFNNPEFWRLIRNTLVLTLYGLATFPLTLVLALLIHEVRSTKLKKTVQMLSYAPHFLSVVVIVGLINLLFSRGSGIVNQFIELLGGTRIDFITTPTAFPHLYVWSGTWQNIGWNTIIYLAALTSISPELIEAAQIDGAKRHQIIWHVNIPTILPTVIILFILATGSLLSVGYEKVYLMQNELVMDVAQVISTYVYEMGLVGGQFSYTTAIGFFNNVVNVIVLIIVNTISKKVSEVSLW